MKRSLFAQFFIAWAIFQIFGCATGTRQAPVFEKNGLRLSLEALPRDGYIPLEVFIHAVLEVHPRIYHQYKGCFALTLLFAEDDKVKIIQGCENYQSNREPGPEGTIRLEYNVDHTLFRAMTYTVVITVRPAGELEHNRSLIKGQVVIVARERRQYSSL